MSGEPNNGRCYTVLQFYPDPKVCIPLCPTQWAKIDCWSCMFSWDRIGKKSKKSLACGPHHPIWPTWASTKMPQWWLPASQHGQGLFPSPHRSATVLLKRFPLQDSEKNDEYLLSHHIWVKMRYSIRYPPVCMCVHVCVYIYTNGIMMILHWNWGYPIFRQTHILSISSESKYDAREAEPRSRSPCRFSHSEREPLA